MDVNEIVLDAHAAFTQIVGDPPDVNEDIVTQAWLDSIHDELVDAFDAYDKSASKLRKESLMRIVEMASVYVALLDEWRRIQEGHYEPRTA